MARAAVQGKKVVTGCCGGKSEAALKRRRPSVRHANRGRRGCARRNGRGTRLAIIEILTDEGTRSPLTAHIFQFLRLAGRCPDREGKRAALPLREPRGPKVNPQ